MTPSLNIDVIKDPVLQTLLSLLQDPIPNIRFNVAKSLETIVATYGKAPEGKALAKEKIIPAVQSLQNDPDADVRYFASRALEHTLAVTSMFFLLSLHMHNNC